LYIIGKIMNFILKIQGVQDKECSNANNYKPRPYAGEAQNVPDRAVQESRRYYSQFIDP